MDGIKFVLNLFQILNHIKNENKTIIATGAVSLALVACVTIQLQVENLYKL